MGCVTLRVYCTYLFMEKNISLPITDLSQLQHMSRDTWTPPCQRAKQEVLEEVLLRTSEIGTLCLQQGNFQGQESKWIIHRRHYVKIKSIYKKRDQSVFLPFLKEMFTVLSFHSKQAGWKMDGINWKIIVLYSAHYGVISSSSVYI